MKKIFLLIAVVSILSSSAQFAFAQTTPTGNTNNTTDCTGVVGAINSQSKCYQQLSPITDPGTGMSVSTSDFSSYLQGIYRIGIGACFVLGVIMFTWAGIEYILSESVTSKSDAKSRIIGALTGLAIVLVSYILLETINPALVKFTNLDTSLNVNAPVIPVTK